MAETMHTQGPLIVRVGANGDVGIIATGQPVQAVSDIGGALIAECYADIRRADEGARAEALANATLFAAASELLAALKWGEQFALRDGEGYNECFERIAEVFHRDTGFLRPGKDAAAMSGTSMEERQAAWDAWLADGRARARAAVARATQTNEGEAG